MKTIDCWQDLRPFGVIFLTGEACGLAYRLLCDVTEQGCKVLGKTFGIPDFKPAAPWNSGSKEEPHVGSILLTQDMLVPVGVFVLLESGCTEVWLTRTHSLLGIEPTDTAERIERYRTIYRDALVRTFAYRGTAGDRNLHVMSGRVE